MQTKELESDKNGISNETVASILAWKHLHEKILAYSTLEAYEKNAYFIPVDITEDVVELVARKLLGSLGPGGTDSEGLHGWVLKFREDIKKIVIVLKLSSTG